MLQAIARTNRVKRGKQRGYVVDYIGLTNNFTEALTSSAANDEQQELASSLKNITSEMPVLQERYQRLLNLFAEHKVKQVRDFVEGKLPGVEADAGVVHAAVTLLKDENLPLFGQCLPLGLGFQSRQRPETKRRPFLFESSGN